jgi:hypothetical protein
MWSHEVWEHSGRCHPTLRRRCQEILPKHWHLCMSSQTRCVTFKKLAICLILHFVYGCKTCFITLRQEHRLKVRWGRLEMTEVWRDSELVQQQTLLGGEGYNNGKYVDQKYKQSRRKAHGQRGAGTSAQLSWSPTLQNCFELSWLVPTNRDKLILSHPVVLQ